jgi:hypothetical protein
VSLTGTSVPAPTLALRCGTMSIVIGRCTLFNRFGADFPHQRNAATGLLDDFSEI